VEMDLAQVDKVRAEAHARRALADRLPDLAGAMGQRVGEMRITQVGTNGNPFESIVQAIAAVVELAKSS